MGTASAPEQAASVPGELHYLAPGPVLRRSAAPAEHASQRSRPWRVLHSAFRDPPVETSVPRHSIEVRTFAFLH
jgi:hypothetical protein